MIAYDRLSQIIPADQALANKALNVSLLQISGIINMTLPVFAEAVATIDNLNDLPLVNALTTAVPPEVANFYVNTLGIPTNTPPNVKIVNVLGTPSGYVHVDALNDTVNQINSMGSGTNYLQTVYQTMLLVVQGFFDVTVPPVPPDPDPTTETIITPGYPAAGTYATHDEAILALILVAQSEIINLQSAYPKQCDAITTNSKAMANQLVTELAQQARAKLNFAELIPNDQTSVYGFIFSLPTYGNDVGPNGMRDYVTKITNQSTLTGQSIIGTLREGQDQTIINSAGIKSNNIIPL
jgi:hypothetical protein